MIKDILLPFLTEMKFNGQFIANFKVLSMDKKNNPEGNEQELKTLYGGGSNAICDYLYHEGINDEVILMEKTRLPIGIINSTDPFPDKEYVKRIRDETLMKFLGTNVLLNNIGLDYGFRIGGKTTVKYILVIEGYGAYMTKHQDLIDQLNFHVKDHLSDRLKGSLFKVTIAEDMLENFREYLTKPGLDN